MYSSDTNLFCELISGYFIVILKLKFVGFVIIFFMNVFFKIISGGFHGTV